MRRKALVAGALGMVGGHVAAHLSTCADWEVVGLSRGEPRREIGWRMRRVDLADPDACRELVASEPGVTHLFHAARAPHADPAVEARTNLAMLAHLVDALEAGGSLRHVCLIQGSKWYGSHLGPFRTPAREDDPPHMPPNFYVDQQRFVEARRSTARWTWSALRPGVVWGRALGYPHNIAVGIAAYAAISRELGLPLRFPGTRACFEALTQATDARLLARAAAWSATDARAADQAFNILDGDLFRWCHLWERLARHFGMENGGVQTTPLATMMADKEPVWRAIVEKHRLRPLALSEIVDWRYVDMTFRQDWDHVSSTIKARRHGFDGFVDTEATAIELMQAYRDERIVP